jgi:preprotein translocase subunit SecG
MSIEYIISTVDGICCGSAFSGRRVSMFTVNIKQTNISKIIIIKFSLFLLTCYVNGQISNYRNSTT